MYELINDKTLAEYEAFLQQHPKGHFAQSSLWAKQKPMWAWNAVAVRGEDGKIKGSLALMSRKVPGIRLPRPGLRSTRPGDLCRAARGREGPRQAAEGLRHQDRPRRPLLRHGVRGNDALVRLPMQGGRQEF